MSAINAINLSRFFLYFIPQDPDPRTQKKADPCGSGSETLTDRQIFQILVLLIRGIGSGALPDLELIVSHSFI